MRRDCARAQQPCLLVLIVSFVQPCLCFLTRIACSQPTATCATRLEAGKAWKKESQLSFLANQEERFFLPELIVLDLDNTLWTPELYQLNPKRGPPKARKDIQLFPDVPLVFQSIQRLRQHHLDDPTATGSVVVPKWAVASRAQNEDWALQLLKEFSIPKDSIIDNNNNSSKNKKKSNKDAATIPLMPDLIDPDLIVIEGGTKKFPLQLLREQTGIPYHKMMFLDDWIVNLEEVAQLGVLSCHCPNGLTWDIFCDSLEYYHALKTKDGDDAWVGYVYDPS